MKKDIRILLSVSELDESFEKMVVSLREYATVDVVDLSNYSLADYDIFIGKKLSVDKLQEANKLKYIFAYKTGVDDFPLAQLEERGVTLINSHADSRIIAEYAFGMSISLVNRITEFDLNLRQGIWYDNENMYWKSIFNMKVGLLGYGHIGKDIHNILAQNNIETYTIDRGHQYENINLVSSLRELIEKCDIIICSVPKTKATNRLFNEKNLPYMKDKFVVNVGRSNVICQKALYNALLNGQLCGAAIDTWEEKPKNKRTKLMPSKYDFHNLNNIILSPHAAMRVENGHERYVMDVTQNIINLITKNELYNVVSYKKGY
jgi:phosphoglycerate dehydrogenase-like enzyme